MTTTKTAPFDLASYKAAAAKLREQFANNMPPPHPDEILPVNGKLHVVLSGKPLPPEVMAELYRTSSTELPEFRDELEKMKQRDIVSHK